MCGRFAVFSPPKEIAKIFAIKQSYKFELSYNVAPTEIVSVICSLPDNERALVSMRWGLVPRWQNPPNLASALINARIETLDSKPSFKEAARLRRCLIVADGFFEWRTTSQNIRQPFFIHQNDHKPFAMAGIWERWVGDDTSIDSCCIITLDANDLLAPLHNRMPAIVKPEDYEAWLNPQNRNWHEAKKLLTSEPHNDLAFYKVSTKVNSAKYKNDDCIEPLRKLDRKDKT